MTSRGLFSVLLAIGAFLAVSAQGAAAQTGLTCDGLAATIVGSPGDDLISGTPGADVIVALGGSDRIFGGAGDDVICAGPGNDMVMGSEGFDIIFGAQGNDLLFSAGNAQNSGLVDSRGARMFGGAGDDTLHGSDRWDRMQGGPGNDTINGYAGQDWIRGGTGDDMIDGGLAVDDIQAGGGSDTIFVANDDVARGGVGFDRCVQNATTTARSISCTERRPAALANNEFRYIGSDYQVTSGRVLGIAPGALAPGSQANGSCHFVLLEMTLGLHPYSIATPTSTTPAVSATGAQRANGRCDNSAAIDRGYFTGASGLLVPGSTFAFYTPVFLPAGKPIPTEAQIIGASAPVRLPLRALAQLPAPPPRIEKDPGGIHQRFADDNTFTYREGKNINIASNRGGEVWTGQIDSVETVDNLSAEHRGTCVVIRGEVTAVSSPDSSVAVEAPRIGGFVNAIQALPADFCDSRKAIAEGDLRLGLLEVPVGETRTFHTSVFVPAQTLGDNELTHITIGEDTTSATVMVLD